MSSTVKQPESPVVLVVDDSQDVHRLLRARLRNEEYEIVSTESGRDALDQVTAHRPSIVLLDLDMPEMDGFEVLRRLKESPDSIEMPVIVLSGLQSAQDKVMAFDLGAMDYISKPFDLTELRVRIRSALRLDRLLQMLSERAHVDGLTGLFNRAHFDERWPEAVAVAHRRSQPLSLAMIDVDHFKSINDSFGHPAGDVVLHGISQEIQSLCRDTDIACRYGGEELALIMIGTPLDKAKVVCERIREQIGDLAWPRHPERAVTVSVGIAGSTGPAPEISHESWLEIADKALYTSKQQGRNRTTVKEVDRISLAEAG